MSAPHLIVFGLGYCGLEVARRAAAAGWRVSGTHRASAAAPAVPDGVEAVAFEDAGALLAGATHLLGTAAPTESDPGVPGDPVLARHGAAIAAAFAAGGLRWAGYLSTTGVYGNRGGGWVDERTEVRPGSPRSVRRVAAEEDWRAVAGARLDLFRLAGIYGPGRSPFAELRAGRAKAVRKPGHVFGRIHRDDIACAVMAAAAQDRVARPRVLNLSDDVPAESAAVLAEAARLLGVAAPAAVPFEVAMAGMSRMALSFWAEDRRVSAEATQRALGMRWRYPSFREGLAATLRQEGGGA
ncbi:MAG: hypothetical protein ACRYG6_01795 [Janthinobacterium lividum]